MDTCPSHTAILIVGAGPTGLALAAELRRRGVETVVLDKLAEGANTSRAAVVHARTLEVLEPLDIVPQMLSDGVAVPMFRVRDRDKTLVALDFRTIPSKYALTLMYPQDRMEAALLARLRALGGDVLRPAEMTDMKVTGDSVDVGVMLDGTSRRITTRWLVGCDGMHSRVREAAGIPFAGAAYEEGFVLADVHMDWPLDRDEVSLFFSPKGLLVVAPLPNDRFRVVATVDQAPEHPTLDYLQALLDERGPTSPAGRIVDIVWTSRFRVHHRIAESARKGVVLVCGDAAHVHSPAGGQGMNTGIQDAMSLAAVLDDVQRGGAESALDAWATERHEVAERVVSLTDRATRMATLHSPIGQALRNVAMDIAGHVPSIKLAVATRIAELDNDRT